MTYRAASASILSYWSIVSNIRFFRQQALLRTDRGSISLRWWHPGLWEHRSRRDEVKSWTWKRLSFIRAVSTMLFHFIKNAAMPINSSMFILNKCCGQGKEVGELTEGIANLAKQLLVLSIDPVVLADVQIYWKRIKTDVISRWSRPWRIGRYKVGIGWYRCIGTKLDWKMGTEVGNK